jgi:membrane-bound ClpP family serine protease
MQDRRTPDPILMDMRQRMTAVEAVNAGFKNELAANSKMTEANARLTEKNSAEIKVISKQMADVTRIIKKVDRNTSAVQAAVRTGKATLKSVSWFRRALLWASPAIVAAIALYMSIKELFGWK